VLDSDEKLPFNFGKPGTYPHFRTIHPNMTGKLLVL
jgi:plastocyanin